MITFVHGWASGPSAWGDFPELLSQSLSQPSLCLDYVNDLNFESTVVRKLKASPSHVVAWSMGGMIVLKHIKALGDSIKSLSLISVPAQFCNNEAYSMNHPPDVVEKMISNCRRNPKVEVKRFYRQCAPRGFLPTDEFNVQWLEYGLSFLKTYTALGELSHVTVPTTIIQGEDDPICLPENARYLQAELPRASLEIVEGGTHVPFHTQKSRLIDILSHSISAHGNK